MLVVFKFLKAVGTRTSTSHHV